MKQKLLKTYLWIFWSCLILKSQRVTLGNLGLSLMLSPVFIILIYSKPYILQSVAMKALSRKNCPMTFAMQRTLMQRYKAVRKVPSRLLQRKQNTRDTFALARATKLCLYCRWVSNQRSKKKPMFSIAVLRSSGAPYCVSSASLQILSKLRPLPPFSIFHMTLGNLKRKAWKRRMSGTHWQYVISASYKIMKKLSSQQFFILNAIKLF